MIKPVAFITEEKMIFGVGFANGTGQQGIVAYVNLASYYLIGLPLGILLGYVFNLEVEVSFLELNYSYLV